MLLNKIQKLLDIVLGPVLRPLAAATLGNMLSLAIVVRVRGVLALFALVLVAFLTNASDLGGRLEFRFGNGCWIRKIEVIVIRKGREGVVTRGSRRADAGRKVESLVQKINQRQERHHHGVLIPGQRTG
jgi:hypothetical protein